VLVEALPPNLRAQPRGRCWVGASASHVQCTREYAQRVDPRSGTRVGARAAGGEVLVTRPVVERARGELEFDRIAEVRLKGFTESTEVFIARERNGR
jgi:hypothetical protein